jgi:hypothetical protein
MASTSNRGPAGQERGIGFAIVMTIVTLGIYNIYWMAKSFQEIKNYRREGVGWWGIFLLIANLFLLPSYVGRMYKEDGREPKVTGFAGFWVLVPYVGSFVYIAKVQGALNDYWRLAHGQPAGAAAAQPA